MGKAKNTNNVQPGSSKSVSVKEKKINPFEVHINREKFKILGRKCKHDRGLPGLSRSKAIQKRKKTLGKEYKVLQKVNTFKDRRIGAGALDNEIATARFVTEKISQLNSRKANLFNLDDEVLTHRGQTLEEIEQMQDVASDESEDDALEAEFTEAVHFGGDGSSTDRKVAIEEMIAESKRKKIEAAKEKDEVYELTLKLDENYKGLIPIIGALKDNDKQKPPADHYDRTLKEMLFEPRGQVTDKLLSKEQIEKKNREKLEKLENERLARMKEDSSDGKPKHKSADDLDDGYFAGDLQEEEVGVLTYSMNDENEKPGIDGDSQNSDEELNDDGDDDEILEESERNEASDIDDDEEEESMDGLSDLKSSDEEDEETRPVPKAELIKNKVQLKQKHIVQNSNNLPNEMPTTFERFACILEEYSSNEHEVIENLIKRNHPKLNANNKDKMVRLFGFLLQFINDSFTDATEETIEKSFCTFDKLIPFIYDLVRMSPEKTSNCLLEIIKEKCDDFKHNPRNFPSVDFAVFFKLVSLLYSTSDFRHGIVTPCLIFLSHILSRSQVRNRSDISVGLFLSNIVLECTQHSKRFIPATLNFVRGILYLCVQKRPIETLKIIPPFQSTGPNNNILVLAHEVKIHESKDKLTSKDFVIGHIDDDFKVRVLSTALKLLIEFIDILKENVGIHYLAFPFLELLEKLEIVNYPNFVQESLNKAKINVKATLNKPMQLLVSAKKKPRALKLMEPRIETVYNDKRRPKLSKEKEERAIMLHKIKRETKGAIREIRRDAAFISKLQISKQIQSDMERKEKVQKIFAEAAVQQGELNALSRKRKK